MKQEHQQEAGLAIFIASVPRATGQRGGRPHGSGLTGWVRRNFDVVRPAWKGDQDKVLLARGFCKMAGLDATPLTDVQVVARVSAAISRIVSEREPKAEAKTERKPAHAGGVATPSQAAPAIVGKQVSPELAEVTARRQNLQMQLAEITAKLEADPAGPKAAQLRADRRSVEGKINIALSREKKLAED